MRVAIQFYVWIILGLVNLLLICISLTFELTILFQLISNITTSIMHPTPITLAEDGITAYILSASNTSKLCSSVTFPVCSPIINILAFFRVLSTLLTPVLLSKASNLPLRSLSVLQMLSHRHRTVFLEIVT